MVEDVRGEDYVQPPQNICMSKPVLLETVPVDSRPKKLSISSVSLRFNSMKKDCTYLPLYDCIHTVPIFRVGLLTVCGRPVQVYTHRPVVLGASVSIGMS